MAPKRATLVLSDFAGDWQIVRRIDDHLAGKIATLSGRAQFTAAPEGLHYFETGQLVLEDNPPILAERRYIWRYDLGRIHVDYGDGRPFHSFDPASDRASARHLCAPDDYRVIYSFARWPNWRADWRVEGPRKNYRMTTEYRR